MFLQNVGIAARQVLILYLIVAVGFLADKCKVFTEPTARRCTDLVFYIVTPAKILESFFNLAYSPETAKRLFIALGCGFVLHAVAALISAVAFRYKCPAERACIFKYASTYGNCGYMGLPLTEAVAGEEGVIYCSAVIITFQVFTFTHGVYLMNMGKPEAAKFDPKKLVLNPGVLAVAVGLPIYLLSPALPQVVTAPVSYIAALNTPLAMLIFGTFIANTDFKSIFREPRMLEVGLIKLFLLPAIMLAGMRLCGLTGTLLTAIIVTASAPSANNTVMFAAKFDRDAGLASQVVAIVSILSILTMPLMIAAAQSVG
ncbi:MAG: AEC family transporter [Clostridia bacterium]|nr:AEC family transporter [Clostridia bacterium]